MLGGTTSACAENTFPLVSPVLAGWNYLRVRGEYGILTAVTIDVLELPPRARRIRPKTTHSTRRRGTTSACAENTRVDQRWGLKAWNYLRVRGEYTVHPIITNETQELPPRARRIRNDRCCYRPCGGTTSACAENTSRLGRLPRVTWNYLRVRGEYFDNGFETRLLMELPPRARRIP